MIIAVNDNTDHIASMLICNSYKPSGVHTKDEVSLFVIQFLNYVRKHLMDGIQKDTEVPLYLRFTTKRFIIWQLQIELQTDRWSSGFRSLLARHNFSYLLSKKIKFNAEFFATQVRIIKNNKMMEGEVSLICSTLLQTCTFMAKGITSKTPVPTREAHSSSGQS